MIDGNFPISRTQAKTMVGGLVGMAIVGMLLFGGYLPGLHPQYTPNPLTTYDGRSYYWAALSVPSPPFLSSHSAPTSSVFRNDTIWRWVTNAGWLGGAYLHGNVTERNGTVYEFVIGGFSGQANWTDRFVAPGASVVVEWGGGSLVYVLLLA